MTKIPQPGADFKPAPAGNWPAVCYRLIDLGTQETEYEGKKGKAHQISIWWELHDEETMTDEGKPMLIFKTFTFSMSEKANLRKVLESWRGKAFTAEDFGNFDMRNLLGVPCLVNVAHKDGRNGTYSYVAGVGKLPK